jgi:cell division protein FtsL
VRNKAYPRNNFSIRERHNERKNEIYSNPDIVQDRSHLNIRFKGCDSTYTQAFDKFLEEGTLSIRGLKADADVFAEMVFDVNTSYFEQHGGYEYAKDFFAEAYRMAVLEVGGEQYILSAVMHADERNKSLSEELNRDVYHYHLHVVYIPVVEKEIRWTKRCKDNTMVGTVKEVIHQVSHSKKWASIKAVDANGEPIRAANGKVVLIPSYSLLQDRFFEYMKAAGFRDFERGIRGSTMQHLSVLDYKIQQDNEKLARIEQQVEAQQKELSAVSKQLTTKQQTSKTFHELDELGRKKMLGKVTLAEQDFKEVVSLAKEGVLSRGKISDLSQALQKARSRIYDLEDSYNRLYEWASEFRQALKLAPQRVKEVFAEIFLRDKEEREARRNMHRNMKQRDERER